MATLGKSDLSDTVESVIRVVASTTELGSRIRILLELEVGSSSALFEAPLSPSANE